MIRLLDQPASGFGTDGLAGAALQKRVDAVFALHEQMQCENRECYPLWNRPESGGESEWLERIRGQGR